MNKTSMHCLTQSTKILLVATATFGVMISSDVFAQTAQLKGAVEKSKAAKSETKVAAKARKVIGCVVIGFDGSGTAPTCAGCGPDAPAKSTGENDPKKQLGEKGFDWKDEAAEPVKTGEVLKGTAISLNKKQHEVGLLNGKIFQSCIEAKIAYGNAMDFGAAFKHVLAVQITD